MTVSLKQQSGFHPSGSQGYSVTRGRFPPYRGRSHGPPAEAGARRERARSRVHRPRAGSGGSRTGPRQGRRRAAARGSSPVRAQVVRQAAKPAEHRAVQAPSTTASARIALWPIRPTPPRPTAPTCGGAVSRRPFRARPTRTPAAAPRAGGHPPSPLRSARSATLSNAASTDSSATAPSPRDTTNALQKHDSHRCDQRMALTDVDTGLRTPLPTLRPQ